MNQYSHSEKENPAQPIHAQTEYPAEGTSLNPLEEDWHFDENLAAAPDDHLTQAMQQGDQSR
ncbi:hypothetical protein [Brevibacillus fulvus]|uniref:Uncharacterized protein n=1 Tax=Brevibacillus fulvus TaxID=1125967 RepID=A0A938Y2U1_9BACL|nr:hypothetical protein [Brevibacillus fulvus]MBM7590946.1 hypothetical protein [Brevibacillus fulvus]